MSDLACDCPRCRVLLMVPYGREDPVAPLSFESWLQENPDDDWVFWVVAGLLVLIGLLVWTPGGAVTLTLLAAAAGVGSLPFLRDVLARCRRLALPAERERQPG